MATQYTAGLTAGQVLTAATMNSIGDAWVDYTPTATSSSGTLTTVSASGRYAQINKLIVFRFSVSITNVGTGGGTLFVTIPKTAQSGYGSGGGTSGTVGAFAEWTATGFMGAVFLHNDTGKLGLLKYNWASPVQNGTFGGFAIYEAA